MILQETIDKVLALPIVEVIQRYNVELKKAGSNFKGFSRSELIGLEGVFFRACPHCGGRRLPL